ncbi:MAG TPA: hypothetical protein VN604_04685, partial [Nitrospirota bacterium]|nr:hypothetical protein [Nitrospirota bacterium]
MSAVLLTAPLLYAENGPPDITREAAEHGCGLDVAEHRIEYLDRFYRHLAGGRARPLAEMLPADMSWHMIGWRETMVPFAGLYSGRDKILHL